MTRARVARSFSIPCRNVTISYVTKAAEVSSSTRPLMTSSIAVSFCLMGQSRSDISAPPPPRRRDLGHPQQLGADRQICGLRRPGVDLEPNAVPVVHEPHHAALIGEVGVVAYGEDGTILKPAQDLGHAIAIGLVDEQDVARCDFVDRLVAPDLKRPPPQLLPAHGLVEKLPERIAPENADDERRRRIGKRIGRPVDELRKVEEKDGLHAVLRCTPGLRRQPASPDRPEQQRRGCENLLQKRHSIVPYTPRSISRRVAAAPNSAWRACRRFCPTSARSRFATG